MRHRVIAFILVSSSVQGETRLSLVRSEQSYCKLLDILLCPHMHSDEHLFISLTFTLNKGASPYTCHLQASQEKVGVMTWLS